MIHRLLGKTFFMMQSKSEEEKKSHAVITAMAQPTMTRSTFHTNKMEMKKCIGQQENKLQTTDLYD